MYHLRRDEENLKTNSELWSLAPELCIVGDHTLMRRFVQVKTNTQKIQEDSVLAPLCLHLYFQKHDVKGDISGKKTTLFPLLQKLVDSK